MRTIIIRSFIILISFCIIAVIIKKSLVPKQTSVDFYTSSTTQEASTKETIKVTKQNLETATTATTVIETSALDTTNNTSTTVPLKKEKQTIEKATKTTKKIDTTTTLKTTTYSHSTLETGFESKMVNMINQIREKEGVNPIELDDTLNGLAQIRAKEISNSYDSSHIRPDGSEWSTILSSLDGTSLNDWYTAGENIAFGQESVEEIVQDFAGSSDHYYNMINSKFNKIGVACFNKNGVRYWAQIFVGV